MASVLRGDLTLCVCVVYATGKLVTLSPVRPWRERRAQGWLESQALEGRLG